MMTITLEEEELITALTQAAQRQATTVEAIIKQALQWHLPALPEPEDLEPDALPLDDAALRKKYPFIGIWHSGTSDLSEQTEEILSREMGPRRVK